MHQVVPGRALGGRGASAVVRGVVGGVVGLLIPGTISLQQVVLGLFPLLAAAPDPPGL